MGTQPETVTRVMNWSLLNENFSQSYKVTRLVLIPKPGSASYRPICLLSRTGKLLEQLLLARMHADPERAGGISETQYGFTQVV